MNPLALLALGWLGGIATGLLVAVAISRWRLAGTQLDATLSAELDEIHEVKDQ